MIFSAGDAGANSLSAPPMGQVTSCNPAHPMWPAESPFVTALSLFSILRMKNYEIQENLLFSMKAPLTSRLMPSLSATEK